MTNVTACCILVASKLSSLVLAVLDVLESSVLPLGLTASPGKPSVRLTLLG